MTQGSLGLKWLREAWSALLTTFGFFILYSFLCFHLESTCLLFLWLFIVSDVRPSSSDCGWIKIYLLPELGLQGKSKPSHPRQPCLSAAAIAECSSFLKPLPGCSLPGWLSHFTKKTKAFRYELPQYPSPFICTLFIHCKETNETRYDGIGTMHFSIGTSGFHLDSLTYVLFQSFIPPPQERCLPSAYKQPKHASFELCLLFRLPSQNSNKFHSISTHCLHLPTSPSLQGSMISTSQTNQVAGTLCGPSGLLFLEMIHHLLCLLRSSPPAGQNLIRSSPVKNPGVFFGFFPSWSFTSRVLRLLDVCPLAPSLISSWCLSLESDNRLAFSGESLEHARKVW